MLSHQSVNAVKTFNASVTTAADVTTDSKILIYSFTLFNTTAAAAYLQVFDKQSGSVSLGTTDPTYVIGIPAVASGGHVQVMLPKPILHTTGLTIAATTTRGGSTTAAVETTITYASEV